MASEGSLGSLESRFRRRGRCGPRLMSAPWWREV